MNFNNDRSHPLFVRKYSDPIYPLRYYKSCGKYVRQEGTKEWKKEAAKWLANPLFTELVEHMRESIYVPKLAPLDVSSKLPKAQVC